MKNGVKNDNDKGLNEKIVDNDKPCSTSSNYDEVVEDCFKNKE